MPTKTKRSMKPTDRLVQAAHQAGLVLMTAAVTVGMLDVPEDSNRVVIPNQPAFAVAESNGESNLSSPIRRERDEKETGTEANYIGYSLSQRTPSRTRTER